MGHQNLIITPPVNILDDLGYVLGTNSPDLGTNCKAGSVNKWALYKPIRSTEIACVTRAQRKTIGHGFGTISKLESSDVINNLLPDKFTYLQPRGKGGGESGQNEWYRVADFLYINTGISDIQQSGHNGYNHSALPAISWCLHANGMTDSTTMEINTFFRRVSDIKIRALYRIGSQSSYGDAGDIQIPIDELKFQNVTTPSTDLVIAATNGASHSIQAPQPIGALSGQSGVGFEIDLSSIITGSTINWPVDSGGVHLFYPRLKTASAGNFFDGCARNPLGIKVFLDNPLSIDFEGSIEFWDGNPVSGGTQFAAFSANGTPTKITAGGTAGETVTFSSNNFCIRARGIKISNSANQAVECTIGGGGLKLTIGQNTYQTVNFLQGKSSATASEYFYSISLTIPANGSVTLADMGGFVDFSFGAGTAMSLTFTSAGGSSTQQRANFPFPKVLITNALTHTYEYESTDRAYYY